MIFWPTAQPAGVDEEIQDMTADEEPEGWESSSSWQQLLYAISYGKCTPFLGAGACAGVLPLGGTIAREWAKKYDYPFDDSHNLPRVAQYVAIKEGPLLPRFLLRSSFQNKRPVLTDPDEPHRVVAGLPLPVYITTNYDSFMMMALREQGKEPIQQYCQWHRARIVSETKEIEVGSAINPTKDKPVVFHLHGLLEDEDSMVLTEDDYLNFLINISEYDVIPSHIKRAFSTNKAFLFIGYSLEDMSFKVLFRKFAQQIASSPGDRHVAVQLHDTDGLTEGQKKRQRDFLQKMFKSQNVKVYWGTAQKFVRKLREEWDKF
jgi:hypothetical protein